MIGRVVNGILDRQSWADGVGELLQKVYLAVLRPLPLVKDLLHGTWLGHALHPAISDVPVGAFTAALFLDLIGEPDGAKWATLVGFVGMLAAALTGIADYTGTDGKTRRYATIHSLLMFFSTTVYLFSVLIRFQILKGTVVGDTIECQCHGSRFDLRTGRVARGPATFDQPAFEVRRTEGRVEVRRMRG